MKKLWLVLFAILSGNVGAQNPNEIESVTVLGSRDNLNTCGIVRTGVDTLASATLRVEYRLIYAARPEAQKQQTEWVLLVGKDHTRFYSKMYDACDSVLDTRQTDAIQFPMQMPLAPVGEVYRDDARKSLTVLQRMPFEGKHIVKYEEPVPDLGWKTESGIDTLEGYVCNKAAVEYGGRRWIAWYTTQIPSNAGPWKLHGLPGLILQATDETGSYRFRVARIEQVELPIVRYIQPVREMTKEKWLRTECGFHGMPNLYFGNNGKHVFFEKGSSTQLDASWSIPYNPIEWPR